MIQRYATFYQVFYVAEKGLEVEDVYLLGDELVLIADSAVYLVREEHVPWIIIDILLSRYLQ